jgi:hypothetical protein
MAESDFATQHADVELFGFFEIAAFQSNMPQPFLRHDNRPFLTGERALVCVLPI